MSDSVEKETGKPEVAVAVIGKAASPKVFEGTAEKFMVWFVLGTVELNDHKAPLLFNIKNNVVLTAVNSVGVELLTPT